MPVEQGKSAHIATPCVPYKWPTTAVHTRLKQNSCNFKILGSYSYSIGDTGFFFFEFYLERNCASGAKKQTLETANFWLVNRAYAPYGCLRKADVARASIFVTCWLVATGSTLLQMLQMMALLCVVFVAPAVAQQRGLKVSDFIVFSTSCGCFALPFSKLISPPVRSNKLLFIFFFWSYFLFYVIQSEQFFIWW